MEPLIAVSTALVVETSEWFDWLRRQLTLGGISLPDEETSVLFIQRAIHLADRVRGAYRHLPDTLEDKLVSAAIVYQCWDLQKRLREETGVPRKTGLMPAVSAVAYVRRLGVSGRQHLFEASDGFQYVITLPSGLWTETLPATEIICNELARLMGLIVPEPAIVAVPPELLTLADSTRPQRGLRKRRSSVEFCPGFRYFDSPLESPDSDGGSPKPKGRNRSQLFGALVFDIWVLNLRPRKYAARQNPALGLPEVVFFDHSQCFVGADWTVFQEATAMTLPGAYRSFEANDLRHIEPWLSKISKLDLNRIWELAFEMPARWYGGRSKSLAHLLDKVAARVWDLRPTFYGSGPAVASAGDKNLSGSVEAAAASYAQPSACGSTPEVAIA
jgi:hypothetical protein